MECYDTVNKYVKDRRDRFDFKWPSQSRNVCGESSTYVCAYLIEGLEYKIK